MPGQLYNAFKGFDGPFDAIVIGSGIGGLSVASILSKQGKKVLVLERHYEIGGFTHTFNRKGYTWDVGLHYVGQAHIEGTSLNKTFSYISDGNIKWAPLDNAYDRAVFGDERFDFVKGKENLRAAFKKYFPDEKDHASIDAYFELLKEVENIGIGYFAEKALPPFLSRLIGPLMRRKFLSYSDKTTLEVLSSITSNEKLIGVLTAQYGDYGLIPSESSFYMHALVANHYMDGAGYPIGGAGVLADTIVPVIEKNGGAVLFSADVKQIIVERNKAIGVEMADGKKIFAKNIISDAGIVTTFSRLLPEAVKEQHQLEEKLNQLEPSMAHMGMYIGLKESAASLKLPACNYWVFPPNQYNHDKGRIEYKKISDTIPVAYISFPAAKDPAWREKHPDLSTVEIIILLPYEWFNQWEGTTSKTRGDAYQEMKKQIGEQMLEILYRVEPQLKGKIDYYEVSSPLSTKKYMNHAHGEIYGAAHTPKRFRQEFMKPYTPVKNLFLTGQDVMVASIAGSMMGGALCASAILRKHVLGEIMK
ncbi:MAG: NAD(P)/FAD-dependent oxidoreductase [Candidatus Uhrbacteria bacterium]